MTAGVGRDEEVLLVRSFGVGLGGPRMSFLPEGVCSVSESTMYICIQEVVPAPTASALLFVFVGVPLFQYGGGPSRGHCFALEGGISVDRGSRRARNRNTERRHFTRKVSYFTPGALPIAERMLDTRCEQWFVIF